MSIRPSQSVAIGQIALGLSLFICLLIIPHYFFTLNQGGVSNYGTSEQTRTLFIFGFAAAAAGTLMASLKLPSGSKKTTNLKISLYLLSLLYVLVLVSTFAYKSGDFTKQLHLWAALVLFLFMLCQSLWIRRSASTDKRLTIAFTLFNFGWIIGILTALEIVHLLFTAQVISGTSFGYMLTRMVKSHEDRTPTN